LKKATQPFNWLTAAFAGRRFTGMKHTASAGATSKSSGFSTNRPRRPLALWLRANFALCIDTHGHVDLELRRLYRIRSDRKALAQGYIRIVDDSGEDYLYPSASFLPVRLSAAAAKVFSQLA
jgi:hypothetical protein